MVDRLQPAADGRLMTLITPWGTDYWTLTYAQGFEGRLPNVMLVGHNATPQAIIARGDHLLALEKTFSSFPWPTTRNISARSIWRQPRRGSSR